MSWNLAAVTNSAVSLPRSQEPVLRSITAVAGLPVFVGDDTAM